MKNKKYYGKYLEGYNSYSKLYKVFVSMIDRCTRPRVRNYNNYGGRGIKVCDEWMGNYKSFCDWALKNGYKENLEIDRIDCNGDYCPENCRWVTHKENNNNRRNNTLLTYKDETHTLSEWAEILGIKVPTLSYRVQKGWDDEKILTTPVDKTKSKISMCRHKVTKKSNKLLNKTNLRKIIKWSSSKRNQYSKEEIISKVLRLKPKENFICECNRYKYKFHKENDKLFILTNETEIELDYIDNQIKVLKGE